MLTDEEIFAMFTGESTQTLCRGMIVPAVVRVAREDFLIAKLDCGIEGRVEAHEGSDRGEILFNRVYQPGLTARAKILEIDRHNFTCRLSFRDLGIPYRKPNEFLDRGQWDSLQEQQDKNAIRAERRASGRIQRVVKHPLFRTFNSTQAEEYLGSKGVGDAVIRPSSKGNDHLAVTWKVGNGVYQHIDVLELHKENDFALGRVLRVGNKYSYSDLDELIVDHVKAMAKKVVEMTQHEKYQEGSKDQTGMLGDFSNCVPAPWLTFVRTMAQDLHRG